MDIKTGKTCKYVWPYIDMAHFQWCENNWSCDCNREQGFPYIEQEEEQDGCETERFFVVDTDIEIDSYEEINRDYSSYSLAECLGKYERDGKHIDYTYDYGSEKVE